MENTPGAGKWARPRGTSITSSEDDGPSETESEPGGLGSANTGSASSLETMEEGTHPEHITNEAAIPTRDAGYACKQSRLDFASNRGPVLQPSNTIQNADCAKGISTDESKGISLEPPVTKLTLSELDIPRIVYNPKLRHDVNFDPELHFRPNLDGETGRRKAQKAGEFWIGLQAQIEEFMTDPTTFESELAGKEWSLQSTLQAVREILGTLVPPEDRSAVEEILDVELLMQQFRKGVADLEQLGSWLARTLKSHCAPMRDEWVDEMVTQLTVGGRKRDVTSLVRGLQSLLGVLEAMKLDVANHQIRCLRPLLIQDTVEFEQTFFMKRIALGKIDIAGAHAWFQTAKSSYNNEEQHVLSPENMWAFFKGFADLLSPSKMETRIPDTFMFDEERIEKLRADILDAINLDVCLRLLDSVHNKNNTQEAHITTLIPVASKSLTKPKFTSSAGYKGALKSTDSHTVSKPQNNVKIGLFSKANGQLDKQRDLDESLRIIDLESEDEESDTESTSSTRRTSFSSATSSLLPRSMETPLKTRDPRISRSILAIVNDASGKNRWQQSYANIALELLRPTPSQDDLSRLESQFTLHLCNSTSSVFQRSESHVLAQLYPLLSDLATQYMPLSATQLFEVATTPRTLQRQSQVLQHALSDVAKQMAHIGTLHWRVWAPLAYLVDPDNAGHVTDTTDPEVRTAGKARGQLTETNHRPAPQRQNSTSESIPAGS